MDNPTIRYDIHSLNRRCKKKYIMCLRYLFNINKEVLFIILLKKQFILYISNIRSKRIKKMHDFCTQYFSIYVCAHTHIYIHTQIDIYRYICILCVCVYMCVLVFIYYVCYYIYGTIVNKPQA